MGRATLAAVVVFGLSACGPDPLAADTCDAAAAHTIVYDVDGWPMYAGQAQVVASCTPCHASLAGVDRHGAPAGLDFDVSTIGGTSAGVDRLRLDEQIVTQHREVMWARVEGGHAPPSSYAGMPYDPAAHVADYHDTSGAPLASLRTDAGRAILRNWLACGSPVVEATPDTAVEAPAPTIGDVLPCETGPCR